MRGTGIPQRIEKMNSDTTKFRPYWLKQALKKEGNPEPRRLLSNIAVDVCIVGGGYTGLWTALLLKETQPELKIAIIDQECCGYGASGSNGGCLLTLSTKFLTLAKIYGEAEARKLVQASTDAVGAIEAFVNKHGIECDLRIDGALYIATNAAQKGLMTPVMDALFTAGFSPWKKLELAAAQSFAGTRDLLEGFFSPCAGSVQPALLTRGMATVVKQMGIELYEKTPMLHLEAGQPPQIQTPHARIRAKRVVLAINAWMASQFKQFSRAIAVVSSDMAITKPCPDQLASLGLYHGASICDSRIFVHYFHTTTDGRLMMGKGGNTFAYGSKMIPSFFETSRYEEQLRQAIKRFFPSLDKVPLDASWNGGSDRSVTGFPFFGFLDGNPAITYGFGYSGNGVVQSYIGGQILRSLVLDLDDPWSRCGFVGGPRGEFPPEPVKWLGSMMVRDAIRRKETAEDAGRRPFWVDNYLSKFAKSAGKADK